MERERVARLLHEHDPDMMYDAWEELSEYAHGTYLAMADAVLADRRERDVTAVEHMESALVDAAVAREREHSARQFDAILRELGSDTARSRWSENALALATEGYRVAQAPRP
jgi:hypothetical protein